VSLAITPHSRTRRMGPPRRSLWGANPFRLTVIAATLALASCTRAPTADGGSVPTYDPFLHVDNSGSLFQTGPNAGSKPQGNRGPTPTLAPLSVTVPVRAPGAALVTPTPDYAHAVPTLRAEADTYVIQPGDTLATIAESFGVSVESLAAENAIENQNLLAVGATLKVPPPAVGTPGPSFKVIPDSELVYGPASAEFDIKEFVDSQGGYLSDYSEDIGTETLTGSEIVQRVAQSYSINPRLLLAILQHRSQWVTNPQPLSDSLDYPLGLVEPNREGLYHQLTWAATELNRGYYLWRASAVATWVLHDGSVVPVDPTINAGTAGVQNLLAAQDDRGTWDADTGPFGLFQTYFFLFGNPFDLAIEPLVPQTLAQPPMQLPFESGVAWAFTGGPHAAWDAGSAWAALDFAPPDVMGCAVSTQWVTAVANGYIVRASDGQVVEDLDGDGFEQTGWDVLYMHVFSQDRVPAKSYVYAGDRIGHPSCEGGVANAAHLHIARKYNGEWIPADGSLPFDLGGWISSGNGVEYDGYLKRGSATLEAAEGASELNMITR
jgi:LasA protease